MNGKAMRPRISTVLTVAIVVLTACGGERPGQGEAGGTAREIGDGRLEGASVGEEGQVVRIFRGIPYATPPVGELRWRPPRPPTSWEGVRDATQWGHRCPQGSSSQGTGDISEDCLYLNVSTPAETTGDDLPVMVFYHGGGLSTGTANSEVYNDPSLPRHGVVLVTVNSRLGPIGYMAHPALTAESEHDASREYRSLRR